MSAEAVPAGGTYHRLKDLLSSSFRRRHGLAGVPPRDIPSWPPPAPATAPNSNPLPGANASSAARPTFIQSSSQNMSNVFTHMAAYLSSPWALTCIFLTIVLNRTLLYASPRRPLRLPFQLRLLVRGLPILLLALHVRDIGRALRCQTSPTYGAGEGEVGGFLYAVGRMTTFFDGEDLDVCTKAGMFLSETSEADDVPKRIKGSLDLLWPLYTTIAASHFVETLSSALLGRTPTAETGMTFFEHSVAFAQAEANSFVSPFLTSALVAGYRAEAAPLPRNVSPEVLYIALVSACSHLTSQLLGLVGRQARYRLYATGVWGGAILAGFAWALMGAFWGGEAGILRIRRFPSVCVVGFIPHLVILFGIAICLSIYALALLLSSLSPPPASSNTNTSPRPSLLLHPRHALSLGYENLQANITFSSLSIAPSDDFYTTLLKVGFLVLTAASEATYLNEGRPIRVPGLTWLEVERRKLLEKQKYRPVGAAALAGSPYAVEKAGFDRAGMAAKTRRRPGERVDRENRMWRAAGEVLRGAVVVAGRWVVVTWMRIWRGEDVEGEEGAGEDKEEEVREEWRWEVGAEEDGVVADEGEGGLYRRFLRGRFDEDEEDDNEFQPQTDLDTDWETETDAGSRMSSRAGTPFDQDTDWESDATATPRATRTTRASTPFDTELPTLLTSPENLASLLDPTSSHERQAAKILAAHLRSSGPLTRRGYALGREREESVLLRGIRGVGSASSAHDAHDSILESVLLSRRSATPSLPTFPTSAEHAHVSAPLCVVCQTSPRSILLFPCRCFAVCEECRVALAVNNYGSCVCCRRGVEGFARVYMP